MQNEAFTTKVPPALASSNPPDIYQQWGGGQEATQIPSGKVADLTKLTSGWISEVGSAAQAWQVNGKQYGVPYDLHTVGFWYRKDLFAKAGITTPPATIDRSSRPTRQAEGRAHRAHRGGQQGQVAGRVLVGVLRAPRMLHGDAQGRDEVGEPVRTRASRRRPRP